MALLTALRRWLHLDRTQPAPLDDAALPGFPEPAVEPPDPVPPAEPASSTPPPAAPEDPKPGQPVSAPAPSPAENAGPAPWWAAPAKPASQPSTTRMREVDADLHDRLNHALDDANIDLPRIPQVTQEVLAHLRDDDGDLQKAAELCGRDPGLTAQVLRVANSVAHRGLTDIRRLDMAFARLGQRTLHGIVLGATAQQLLINVGPSHRSVGVELWRRALASGVIASHLAPQFSIPPHDALLAGLLHDIGMLAVLRVCHSHQKLHGRPVSRTVFESVAARWHEPIGLRVASLWNLPEPLPELVGDHHREPAADDPLAPQRLLVQFTDLACGFLGYAPVEATDFLAAACCRRLGLHDDESTHRLLDALPGLVSERLAAD